MTYYHEKKENSILNRSIAALMKASAPMHTREIAEAINKDEHSKLMPGHPESSITSALSKATYTPDQFTPLVRLGDGRYELSSYDQPSIPMLGLMTPEKLEDLLSTLRPINHGAIPRTEVEQEHFETEVLRQSREYLSLADREGLLRGELSVHGLVNAAHQRGMLVAPDTFPGFELLNLVPYMRQAVHEREWDDLTGFPIHVWIGPDRFVMGNEAPQSSQLMELKSQDQLAFRATVRATLEHLGATDITDVKKDKTVMFRAVLRGRRLAVSAHQDFAPVDQTEVQSLRGALNQADEEGFIFNLGTISDEARTEINKSGGRRISFQGFSGLLATLARNSNSPTTT